MELFPLQLYAIDLELKQIIIDKLWFYFKKFVLIKY